MGHYLQTLVTKELDERQMEAMTGLFRERNKTLIEIATIKSETRNREANNIRDPFAFTSFSYMRNMSFSEERRKL
jgi:hypothetical protein